MDLPGLISIPTWTNAWTSTQKPLGSYIFYSRKYIDRHIFREHTNRYRNTMYHNCMLNVLTQNWINHISSVCIHIAHRLKDILMFLPKQRCREHLCYKMQIFFLITKNNSTYSIVCGWCCCCCCCYHVTCILCNTLLSTTLRHFWKYKCVLCLIFFLFFICLVLGSNLQ